jgi:hypothetical protein
LIYKLKDWLDVGVNADQLLVAYRLTVKGHALIDPNQMRRSEASGSKSVFAQDALNESGGRSFPVGTGDVNYSVGALWVPKKLNCASGWLKPWSNFVFRNAKQQLF